VRDVTRTASHAFEEHRGEVQVRIEASTLVSLFAEGGAALAELMLGTSTGGPLGSTESVHVKAVDLAALFVAWLNELVFLSETRKRVYTEFELEIETEDEPVLRGAVRGPEVTEIVTAVKAATLHGVQVEENAEGYRATVVLDV
jgi:SHS2 domain-containing protein